MLLHTCYILRTYHTFPELLITLTKKGQSLRKYILLITTNTKTESILLLLTTRYSFSHVLKLKRIFTLRQILKGLLIIFQLMIHSNMLHWLLTKSCRHGPMLWMRIGVRNILSSLIFQYRIIGKFQ